MEFNIHYHRADKIHYAVRKKGFTALSGSYVAKRSDGYCLMWRNVQRKPMDVDYRFTIGGEK